MRKQLALVILILIALFSSILSVSAGESATQSGELILRNGPWHVGDEIEFSILVHNSGDEEISTFLQIEIQGDYSNGTPIDINSGNSVELISTFISQYAGMFVVNWTVYESTENLTGNFTGSTEIIIYEQQLLFTEIYTLNYDVDDGFSVNWGANLSAGNSRLISAQFYFLTDQSQILSSEIEMILEPGLRTSNTILGMAPLGTYKVKIMLNPINWSPLSSATDSENLDSQLSDLSISIKSGPTPNSPTIGDAVSFVVVLENNGPIETGSGVIIAVDGQKRLLAEYGTSSINSASEESLQINIDQWMSTSTTTLEFIWLVDDYIAKTNVEVISSDTKQIVEESNFSINWMILTIGAVISLGIIFSVRIISARNQIESKETKSYSTRRKKVEEKVETQKRAIDCPSCSKQLQLPIEYSGQVKCPACLTQFSTKSEFKQSEPLEKVEQSIHELTASSSDDVVGCPKCDQVLKVPYGKRPAKARCPACKCIFKALAE